MLSHRSGTYPPGGKVIKDNMLRYDADWIAVAEKSLRGNRIFLTIAEVKNARELLEAVVESLPELRAFPATLPWAVSDQTIESLAAFCAKANDDFRSGREFNFIIWSHRTRQVIGCNGIHHIDWMQIPTKSPADSEMMSPGWRTPCWQ
jgi:hypothetical protein